MEGDIMPFIIASVFLIFFITLSIRMQVSTIQGMNDVTVDASERIGYKVAGSMHLMEQGDHMGVLKSDDYAEMKQQRETGCGANLPGFRSDDPLRFGDDNDCGEVERPLEMVLTVRQESGPSVYNLTVGETSEGFN